MPLPSTFKPFRKPPALAVAGSQSRQLSRTGMMLFWFHFIGEIAENRRTVLHSLFREVANSISSSSSRICLLQDQIQLGRTWVLCQATVYAMLL
jgi:hypothetical protein